MDLVWKFFFLFFPSSSVRSFLLFIHSCSVCVAFICGTFSICQCTVNPPLVALRKTFALRMCLNLSRSLRLCHGRAVRELHSSEYMRTHTHSERKRSNKFTKPRIWFKEAKSESQISASQLRLRCGPEPTITMRRRTFDLKDYKLAHKCVRLHRQRILHVRLPISSQRIHRTRTRRRKMDTWQRCALRTEGKYRRDEEIERERQWERWGEFNLTYSLCVFHLPSLYIYEVQSQLLQWLFFLRIYFACLHE